MRQRQRHRVCGRGVVEGRAPRVMVEPNAQAFSMSSFAAISYHRARDCSIHLNGRTCSEMRRLALQVLPAPRFTDKLAVTSRDFAPDGDDMRPAFDFKVFE